MIFHIVKQDETLKDLIFKYGLDKSEIISNNRHISEWDTLIPGVKLKIPIVNNNLYEHLEEVEPFIEDYYPNDSYDINEVEQSKKQDNDQTQPTNNISVNYVADDEDEPQINEYTKIVTNETQEQYKVNYQDNVNQDKVEEQYQDNDQAQYNHTQYQEIDQTEYDYTQYQDNNQVQNNQFKENDHTNYDYTQYQDNNQEQYQEQNPNQSYQTNQQQDVNPNYYQQPLNNGLLEQNLSNLQVNPYLQVNNSINPAYYYQLAMANQYRSQGYKVLYYNPINKQYFYL